MGGGGGGACEHECDFYVVLSIAVMKRAESESKILKRKKEKRVRAFVSSSLFVIVVVGICAVNFHKVQLRVKGCVDLCDQG